MILSIFSCAYLLSLDFPQKNIHFNIWPISVFFFFFFLSWFVYIFDIELHELFARFGDELLVVLFLCKLFLPILRVVLIFL